MGISLRIAGLGRADDTRSAAERATNPRTGSLRKKTLALRADRKNIHCIRPEASTGILLTPVLQARHPSQERNLNGRYHTQLDNQARRQTSVR
jgi:hypothetical protein